MAKLAAVDADGLPVRFDKLVDFELPRRLVCFRPDCGRWETRREMRPDERDAVGARAAALESLLRPFGEDEAAAVEANVLAMLAGFRSMRLTGEEATAIATITRGVLRSRKFPAWAVAKACLKIAAKETKYVHFAPNDAELVEIVEAVVRPYREALDAAERLHDAVPARPEPPKPAGTEVEEVLGHPVGARPAAEVRGDGTENDGKHWDRVKADLEARRARNEARRAGDAA